MSKEMLINVSEGEECRIAILEDGRLEELYMERTSSTSHVGNIYKGRVTNVEPSIQAAFIDFGLGRNGFLHISDLMPTYFGREGEDIQETVGRKMARRDRPPIQRCLRRGDEIVVQIIKEGIGTKGPTLTTYLSIPGKILVMMPGMGNSGVSRKIEDDEERRRLRQILDALKPPDDAGFIIRTAGVGGSKTEIQRDLLYLTRLWTTFKKKRDSGPGPMELYTEGDLITRTVRDVFSSEVDRLVIDNKEVVKRVKEVIKLSNPRTRNKVELYEDVLPLFSKYGIEKEIEMMYSRHVPLPSGGSLVIDSTEAIVAIDVNSGKNRANSDAETTAFKVDMEAADEITRQLKLRDLGGVIIVDFIDLRYERHRRDLEHRLHENLKNDRAKTKVLRMSQFGIIEMTRQRMRPSLKRSVYFDCPHCKGAGLVKTPESMSLDVMRRLRIAIHDARVTRVELGVCADVAFYLQNKKRFQLGNLETDYDKRIVIRAEPQLGLDEMKIDLYDNRDGLVFVEELGMVPQPPHTTQLGTRSQPPAGRGRGGQNAQQGGRGGRDDRHRLPPPAQRRRSPDQEQAEDRFERAEEEFEEREQDREEEHEHEPDREQPIDRRPDQGRGQNIDRQCSGRPPMNRQAPREEVDATEIEGESSDQMQDARQPRSDPGSQGEQGPEEGGRKRRRRRRGRRGRGRNREFAEGQQAPSNGHPAPDADVIAESPRIEEDVIDVEIEESAPRIEQAEPIETKEEIERLAPGPQAVDEEAQEPAADEETEAKPRRRRRGGRGRGRKAPARAAETPASEPAPPPAPEAAVVVRTGSTDRHLIEDEPAFPQPVRRPRSVRDLDHIPDDFD